MESPQFFTHSRATGESENGLGSLYKSSNRGLGHENGKILKRRHMTVEQVIPPSKAFIMNSLLNSVVVEGTASFLKRLGIGQPVAGKTGTTNDSRDAWFVGYTPDILAMVWVGFDDGTSMRGTGASAALPIWADLMKNIPQSLRSVVQKASGCH